MSEDEHNYVLESLDDFQERMLERWRNPPPPPTEKERRLNKIRMKAARDLEVAIITGNRLPWEKV